MPVTATASGHDPASAATYVYPSGRVRVTWTPSDNVGNPITGTTLTVNGRAVAYTTATLAGGVKRLTTVEAPMYGRKTNSVTSTATTTDANVNTSTWTFDVRTAWGSGRAGVAAVESLSIAATPGCAARLSEAVTVYPPTPARAAMSVLTTGVLAGTPAKVSCTVVYDAQGLFNGTPAGVLYWVVIYSWYRALGIGGDIVSDPAVTPMPIGGNLFAEATNNALGIGGGIFAESTHLGIGVGGNIDIESTYRSLPVGGDPATPERTSLQVGGDIEAVEARLDLEYPLTSKSIQDMEDDL